jgi:hypothetical protein
VCGVCTRTCKGNGSLALLENGAQEDIKMCEEEEERRRWNTF